MFRNALGIALGLALLLPAAARLPAAPPKPTTYGQDRDFLAAHTKIVELTSESGARVAICPEYQGRVMTSTTDGAGGRSFGWINRAFIEQGERHPRFNNYGGEDRFWLGPEGGQFSLWFAGDARQDVDNWYTPAALGDGAFQIVSGDNDPYYRLARRLDLKNAAGTRFNLDVDREIRILGPDKFGKLFGEEAAAMLAGGRLRMVGFQSVNRLINRGPAMTRDKGLVAIWILGMFPPSAQTEVIVPFRAGDEAALGPPLKSDYFGAVPEERLRVGPQAALFRADGQFRSKIGVSQRRARNVAGAIDLAGGALTLVHFSMPEDPTAFSYVNNAWEMPQQEPLVGDVFNSYNDGSPGPGKPSLGGFFELESLSPAAELPTGKGLGHTHSTFHIEGDPESLLKLARAALGVEVPLTPPPVSAGRPKRSADR